MILLVHGDITPWASYHRAQELKKRWPVETVVKSFSDDLAGDYKVIHFLYSGGITKHKEFIIKNKDKVYLSLASQRTLDGVYDKLDDLKEVYRAGCKTVAHNPVLAEELKKLTGLENIVYIPNGVDEKIFNHNFTAGFVGANVNNDHKGYKIAQQACAQLGIPLISPFNGNMSETSPKGKMPEFYQKINCLLNLSRSEGCNNPTLEALAMNIPVITTNVGIAHLLPVTVVRREVDDVKKALSRLHTRAQILKNYTWDIIAKRYFDLYEQV